MDKNIHYIGVETGIADLILLGVVLLFFILVTILCVNRLVKSPSKLAKVIALVIITGIFVGSYFIYNNTYHIDMKTKKFYKIVNSFDNEVDYTKVTEVKGDGSVISRKLQDEIQLYQKPSDMYHLISSDMELLQKDDGSNYEQYQFIVSPIGKGVKYIIPVSMEDFLEYKTNRFVSIDLDGNVFLAEDVDKDKLKEVKKKVNENIDKLEQVKEKNSLIGDFDTGEDGEEDTLSSKEKELLEEREKNPFFKE